MLNFETNKSRSDKLFNNNNCYTGVYNLAISAAVFYALLRSRMNPVTSIFLLESGCCRFMIYTAKCLIEKVSFVKEGAPPP